MVRTILNKVGPFVVAAIIIRLTVLAALPVGNNDVFFHLRAGAELGWPWNWSSAHHWSPYARSSWVSTQPLSESLLNAAETIGGLAAVAWLHGLALLAFVASVYWVTRKRGSSLAAAFAVCIAVALAASTLAAVRPQMLGLIFIVWTLHLWLLVAEDGRRRWVLVPFMWLFAMVHGYWLIGAAIGAAIAIGTIAASAARRVTAVHCGTLWMSSILATLLTPLGVRLPLGPLAVGERSSLITEWARTDVLSLHTWAIATVIAIAAFGLAKDRRLTWPLLAVVASAGLLLFYSERTADIAGALIAPLAGWAVDEIRGVLHSRSVTRLEWAVPTFTAIGALAVLAVVVPATAADESQRFPTAMSPYLADLPRGTPVFTSEQVGGWLGWRHRQLAINMDGFMDAYTIDHLRRTAVALAGGEQWRQTVDATGAQIALLESERPLTAKLQHSGWHVKMHDAGYTLLER